jgi:hypothetical protein
MPGWETFACSIELLYKICVMCENLFRTRITRMNTDKKQESVKSV